MVSDNRLMMRVLRGEVTQRKPIWVMRQAGRYLPEYRATRKEAGSFLDLCYTPKLACEVTLQPIRRFGFDASILFSDILVIPDALGQSVRFEEGIGPILEPLSEAEMAKLDPEVVVENLSPVMEAVDLIRTNLPEETTLLGFCGAPWTVATYMVGGRGSPDQILTRRFAYEHEDVFANLIDVLVESSIRYLRAQLDAGADAVQVFDSWAGSLHPSGFQRWCVEPMARIRAGLAESHPDAPVIGFPKGGSQHAGSYVDATGINALGLDWSTDVSFVRSQIPQHVATQGAIDPLLMTIGGPALDKAVDDLLERVADVPHVVNLGHGITPDGKPEAVSQLIERVRAGT